MAKIIIDPNDPDTFVVSRLDGKKYVRIGFNHPLRFGMTLDEYIEKFKLDKKDLVCVALSKNLAFTEKVAIERYGEVEGKIKWDAYRNKQAISNKFEYKNEKYGMTKEEFKSYNISRSQTLENSIKRHGKKLGREKWDNYCKRQATAGCSLEYFEEKYGEVDGRTFYDELCKRKAITLSNMITVHGVVEGQKRYNSWVESQRPFYSLISQELFDSIKGQFVDNKTYYPNGSGGKEYSVYDDINHRLYFYDYVDLTLNKCIEFHGDCFHGNPEMYKHDDTPNFYDRSITCQQMWDNDSTKINCLKRLRNIDTLVIWEKDYRYDKSEVVEKCINFLKNDS